jgi:trk system potassium uptake protein TrkA
MYIIVIGGGKVGYQLGKALLTEAHEILIIEKERARIELISNDLGSVCMLGDGCEVSTLAEAGAARADMLISVTGDDEDNLVTCQVAKHKFKVPRTIARINNPNNEAIFRMLGIDVTINSTDVIMESIQQEVPTHMLTHLMTLHERGMEMVEIKIPSDARSVGKKVKDLELPPGSIRTLVIRRDQKPWMATPDLVIQTGDQIIALTPTDTEDQLKSALKGK